jgi:hypothetical protein
VGSNKFCVKERLPGSLSCGTTRHETSKFEASYGHGYVKFNEIQAHCSPSLNIEDFSDDQVEVLGNQSFTLPEWTIVFDQISGGINPDWLPTLAPSPPLAAIAESEAAPNATFQQLSILSPTAGQGNLFDFRPSLSFDSSDSSLIEAEEATGDRLQWRTQVLPQELLSHVDQISTNLKKIKMAWSRPFHDIEAGYRLVVADLKTVHNNVQTMHAHLGNPLPLTHNDQTVWEALEYLLGAYMDLANMTSEVEQKVITSLEGQLLALGIPADFPTLVTLLKDSQMQINNRLDQMENLLRVHADRFKNIRPILEQIPSMSVSGSYSEALGSRHLTELETRLSTLEQKISTKGMDIHFAESLSTVQEEIRLLQQRIVGSGVAIGPQIFQSYEDLVIWTKTNLPSGRFGLFVDGHSLLDFFSFIGFLGAESVANSFHSSNKSGFKSMLETRVAASMQNYFPAPFGKVAGEKIEDSESLPGITDPDKFDNGSTGVCYKILRGMKDVSLQLESNIDKVLRDYPDAKQMARDLLLNSKRFVIDLLNFMSQDYSSWKLRGYTKKEAWKMTCRSVHRILDDLQGARMTGRDAGDGSDTDRMTATYIWATAKAHEVMGDYLKYQFFEHPAIAAVLARHLAVTAVLPDESLTARFNALELRFSKISSKVDSLVSKAYYAAAGQAAAFDSQSYTTAETFSPPSPTPQTYQSKRTYPKDVRIAEQKNTYRGGNN